MSSSVFSQIDEEHWNTRYKDVCGDDGRNQFCNRLKNNDGSWVAPKNSLVELLKISKPKIDEVAKKFDLDPRHIVAPILVENSLNVQVDDEIQNFLVGAGVLKKAEIFGKPFSIGIGQLNLSAALEVEPLAAKIEGRLERTQQEIASALLTPEGTFVYAAAIAKNVIDVYEKYGYDIADKPEIVATLYNIGKYEERAKKAKEEGREPTPNYFGFFAEKYSDTISGIATGNYDNLETQEDKKFLTKVWEKIPFRPRAKKDVFLRSKPSSCSSNGRGQNGEYNKFETSVAHKIVDVVDHNIDYKIVGTAYGCEASKWILIKDKKGRLGWVEDGLLNSPPSESIAISEKKVNSCASKLRETLGEDKVKITSEGEISLKFLSSNESGKVDWEKKNLDFFCNEKPNTQGFQSNFGSASPFGVIPQANSLSKDEALEVLKKRLSVVKKFKADVLKRLDLENWNSSKNPYKLAFGLQGSSEINKKLSSFNNSFGGYIDLETGEDLGKYYNSFILEKLEDCVSGVLNCDPIRFASSSFDESLFNFDPKVSFSDIQALKQNLNSFQYIPFNSNKVAILDEEIKKLSLATIRKCGKFTKEYPSFTQLNSVFDKVRSGIKRAKLGDELPKLFGGSIEHISQADYKKDFIDQLAQLESTCSYLSRVLSGKEEEQKNIACDQEEVFLSNSSFSQWVDLDIGIVRELIQGDKPNFDTFFSQDILNNSAVSFFTQKNNLFATRTISSQEEEPVEVDPTLCSYDPFENYKFIQSVLDVSCVDSVSVPDPWLVKRGEESKKDLLYREFVDKDQFIINIR